MTSVPRRSWITFVVAGALVQAATIEAAPAANEPDFVQAVEATHPILYLRLDATSGASDGGTARFTSAGAVDTTLGAPVSMDGNRALSFNGVDGYVDTTHRGAIGSTGSIMAWVRLAVLPSKSPHLLYVAGESQFGNDFDLQFEPDNALHFYTADGSNIRYAPDPDSLLFKWHMIVVTLDCATKNRSMYWDGQPVATDAGGGRPVKTSEFSLGDSKVFSGRVFNGAIDEAALWDRVLSASEVRSLFASTRRAGPHGRGQ
jgi:hypothetical protein